MVVQFVKESEKVVGGASCVFTVFVFSVTQSGARNGLAAVGAVKTISREYSLTRKKLILRNA